MFHDIDRSVIEDESFKEDSVRELIIAPIIAKLGYGTVGTNRAARSPALKNPFIRVGTRKHPVTIIPDYMLYANNRPVFVLDAKAPNQSTIDPKHVEQTYSYAFHPEVKVAEFGLCNGLELTIFDMNSFEPVFSLPFEEFESRWDDIEKYLTPRYLLEPALRKFAPDLGTALVRMGLPVGSEVVLPGARLNLFAKIDDELMTTGCCCDIGGTDHYASFDFHPDMLGELTAGLPKQLKDQFENALKRAPFKAAAGLCIEVDIITRVGQPTQGVSETFVPLLIQEVREARFNPSPIPNDPGDIPNEVYQLRKAFKIRGQ
ncbi:hypothetical protein C84B14_05636 [Salinisphaera sp. C84B14]|uniref:hypothetical protein n=1 Tax=Salinisphaera sp. C84B14 TaxID=1304155 RepID=UPI00333F6204